MANEIYVCKCGSRRAGKYISLFGKDKIIDDTCSQCTEPYTGGSFDHGSKECVSVSCATGIFEPGDTGTRYFCTCCGDWEGSGSYIKGHLCTECLKLPKEDRQPKGFKKLDNTQLMVVTINKAKRPFCCINCGEYLPLGDSVHSFQFDNTDKTHIFGTRTLGFVCWGCATNGATISANHYVGMYDASIGNIHVDR